MRSLWVFCAILGVSQIEAFYPFLHAENITRIHVDNRRIIYNLTSGIKATLDSWIPPQSKLIDTKKSSTNCTKSLQQALSLNFAELETLTNISISEFNSFSEKFTELNCLLAEFNKLDNRILNTTEYERKYHLRLNISIFEHRYSERLRSIINALHLFRGITQSSVRLFCVTTEPPMRVPAEDKTASEKEMQNKFDELLYMINEMYIQAVEFQKEHNRFVDDHGDIQSLSRRFFKNEFLYCYSLFSESLRDWRGIINEAQDNSSTLLGTNYGEVTRSSKMEKTIYARLYVLGYITSTDFMGIEESYFTCIEKVIRMVKDEAQRIR